MLGMSKHLVFPNLKFVREGTLSKPESDENSSNGKSIQIYRLDWEQFDEYKKERELKYRKAVYPNPPPSRVTLPRIYESIIKDQLFALNTRYRTEISRNARRANEEWSIERPFDTMIRDACLEPAISHVSTAFYLLADCVYDPDTKYWDRSFPQRLKSGLMLYKFWMLQTGGGMCWYHAGFNDLETEYGTIQKLQKDKDKQHLMQGTHVESRQSEIPRALKAIKEMEQRLNEELFEYQRSLQKGPVVGEEKFRVSDSGVFKKLDESEVQDFLEKHT